MFSKLLSHTNVAVPDVDVFVFFSGWMHEVAQQPAARVAAPTNNAVILFIAFFGVGDGISEPGVDSGDLAVCSPKAVDNEHHAYYISCPCPVATPVEVVDQQ